MELCNVGGNHITFNTCGVWKKLNTIQVAKDEPHCILDEILG